MVILSDGLSKRVMVLSLTLLTLPSPGVYAVMLVMSPHDTEVCVYAFDARPFVLHSSRLITWMNRNVETSFLGSEVH